MTASSLMQGRTCMVTGTSRGIGKATAAALAGMGAHVVLVCRDRERGEAAQGEIRARSSSETVELIIADLSSQRQIRQLAADFRSKHDRLHVLVNNAGTFESGRSETEDGLEATFAVNHLAPFLLTNLLLPVLVASAPSRIVTVSSAGHGYGTKINFDDLQGERRYGGMRSYSQSKLANVLFTYELARRLEGSGVTAHCVHPGAVDTGFLRYKSVLGVVLRALMVTARPFLLNAEQGAATSVYVASSPEVDSVTGRYFKKQEIAGWPMGFNAPVRAVRSSKQSYDESVARRLWQVSEELTS